MMQDASDNVMKSAGLKGGDSTQTNANSSKQAQMSSGNAGGLNLIS